MIFLWPKVVSVKELLETPYKLVKVIFLQHLGCYTSSLLLIYTDMDGETLARFSLKTF